MVKNEKMLYLIGITIGILAGLIYWGFTRGLPIGVGIGLQSFPGTPLQTNINKINFVIDNPILCTI